MRWRVTSFKCAHSLPMTALGILKGGGGEGGGQLPIFNFPPNFKKLL